MTFLEWCVFALAVVIVGAGAGAILRLLEHKTPRTD